MNLKTAITPVLLAALAPGLQAQDVSTGTDLGPITFAPRGGPPMTFGMLADTCVSLYVPQDVSYIAINPDIPAFETVQCTIYSATQCQGDEYTLGAGSRSFSRPFIAGSFKCTIPAN
ncbi:hypothetical protein BDW69DRAFT_169219, partial [Aspergillus filifer]